MPKCLASAQEINPGITMAAPTPSAMPQNIR